MPLDERLNNLLLLNGREPVQAPMQQPTQPPLAPPPQVYPQPSVSPIQKAINWQNSKSSSEPRKPLNSWAGGQVLVKGDPSIKGSAANHVSIVDKPGPDAKTIAYGVREDRASGFSWFDPSGKPIDFDPLEQSPLDKIKSLAGQLRSKAGPSFDAASDWVKEKGQQAGQAFDDFTSDPNVASVTDSVAAGGKALLDKAMSFQQKKSPFAESTPTPEAAPMPQAAAQGSSQEPIENTSDTRATYMQMRRKWEEAGLTPEQVKMLSDAWLRGRDANEADPNKLFSDRNPVLPLHPRLLPDNEFVTPEKQDEFRNEDVIGKIGGGGGSTAPQQGGAVAGGDVDAPRGSGDSAATDSSPSPSFGGQPSSVSPLDIPSAKTITAPEFGLAAKADPIGRSRKVGRIPGASTRLQSFLNMPELRKLEAERADIDGVRNRLKEMLLEQSGRSKTRVGYKLDPQMGADLDALRNSVGGINKADLGPLLSFTSSWGKLKNDTSRGYKAPMDNDELTLKLLELRENIAKVENVTEKSNLDRVSKLYDALMSPIDKRYTSILGALGRADAAGNNYLGTLLRDQQHIEDSNAQTSRFNAQESNRAAIAGARAKSEADKFNATQQNKMDALGVKAKADDRKGDIRFERQKAMAQFKADAKRKMAEAKAKGGNDKLAKSNYDAMMPIAYARIFGEAYVDPKELAKQAFQESRFARQDQQFAGLMRFLNTVDGGMKPGYVGEWARLQTLLNGLSNPVLRNHYKSEILESMPK